jgi:hypothetical protein
MTNARERCLCWSRGKRAQLCGRINRRVVECRIGGAILGGTEPHLGKPDRRDDGEIRLVHWRPPEVGGRPSGGYKTAALEAAC